MSNAMDYLQCYMICGTMKRAVSSPCTAWYSIDHKIRSAALPETSKSRNINNKRDVDHKLLKYRDNVWLHFTFITIYTA